jgi:SAM-dependent methyltransferase
MGYFDNEKHVEEYIQLAEGYDGAALVQKLRQYLPKKSSVLELGMGPGKDLLLMETYYKVTGSDASQIFLDRFRSNHMEADLLCLDAVTLETDRVFNAIYSNKVMHHLNHESMKKSFNRQAQILEPGGIILHSFWYGEEVESIEDMEFYQVTELSLQKLLSNQFKILEMKRYQEMEEGDSLYLICELQN